MDLTQLQDLIRHYGYLAVFVGAVLEGETVLVLSGFAAHRGYLDLGWVIVIATLGGFAGDQFFFVIGRAHGSRVLARFPAIHAQAGRAQKLISRHQNWLIVGVRFMYGLRVAGPVLLGMSKVSHLRFAALNFVGAAVWATGFGGAGYLFGEAVELVLADARRYEGIALGLIVLAGTGVWLYRRQRLKRSEAKEQ
jgi:membrane protein DedA with SNARE-associated domain